MTMKRLSLTMKVLIPALFLLTGFGELYLVYYPKVCKTQIDINLSGFLINLLYGIAVGSIYMFYENKKADKWVINLPRLLSLFLPMIIVSIFFLVFKFERLLLTDTIGMPYLSFTEIYYGERLAAHLSYFCSGFFLISIFSKNNALKKKQNWIKYLCFSITFILLIFIISFISEKILSHAMTYQDFSYYTYEFIVLFINIIFGILLWIMLNLAPNTFKIIRIKKTFSLAADLFTMLMGIIPFIFIYISYHTNFTIPYNNPYYSYLRFFRQSDFFQVFQILFGLMLIPSIKNVVCNEK